jgi:tryptophanyl-tRNA synthetase
MPAPYIAKSGARIMSLQEPDKKMSKSDENEKNFVSIIEDPKKIEKKIKSAATDSGTEVKFDPENKAGVSNLLTIFSILSGRSIESLENDYVGKMYGHLKVDLAEVVLATLKPVRDEYDKLMKDPAHLETQMAKGADRARVIAAATLKKVYDAVGLVPRR